MAQGAGVMQPGWGPGCPTRHPTGGGGGRTIGPYADSLPLSSQFQGGGGGVGVKGLVPTPPPPVIHPSE